MADGAARDERALRQEVVARLRRSVGFDAYAFVLTDPATTVGVAPVADVPWLPELPDQIRLKYLTAVNRWTSLGDPPVAFLHAATGGDLSRSLVWRDLLVRYDVCDAASVVFADRFGCWAFLELWRTGGSRRFGPDDAAVMVGLTRSLTTQLRQLLASTFVAGASAGADRVGPVVLLVSPELQVRSQTPLTPEYLRALLPPAEGHDPVPSAAYNVAAQLLAVEAGVDSHPAMARVHVRDGLWMTVRAARMEGPGPQAGRDIAVTLEVSSVAERGDVFARACGLTDRERELLARLATGETTHELAQNLFLSEHTVQDHLKSIFAKTGVHSRRSLLSRALGS